MRFFRAGFRVSERRACRVAGVHRMTMRYRSQARDQSPLRQRITEVAAVRARYGYRRIHILLRREGAGEREAGVSGSFGERENIVR